MVIGLLLAIITALPVVDASHRNTEPLPALPGAANVAPAAEAGEVVAATSELLLLRGDDTFQASSGALILSGDRLVSGGTGVARLLLDDGQVVALASGTMLVVQGTPGSRFLSLESGEVRVTAGGSGRVTIDFGRARAEVSQGIVRAAVQGRRLEVERGSAQVTSADRAPFTLRPGGEISLSPDDRPVLASTGKPEWTLGDSNGAANDARALLAMQTPSQATPSIKPTTPVNPVKPISPSATTPGEPKPPVVNPDEKKPRDPKTTTNNELPPAPDETEATRGGPLAPPEEATRAAGNQPGATDDPNNPANRPYQPVAVAQPASTAAISLTLGGISASSSAASSGALFSDAQQESINLSFPGNVHLVTAQTSYALFNVNLKPIDRFPVDNQLWSVGIGASPKSQVMTNVGSGTNLVPTIIRIPHTLDYLVRFDQVRFKDQTTNASTNSSFNALGITGFTGTNPLSPQVIGAKPLTDPAAILNNRLTFALGEFGLSTAGRKPILNIRSSDQDRQIIQGPLGTGGVGDKVTPNSNVNFTDVHDAKFFPNLQFVKVPVNNTAALPTVKHSPTYTSLSLIQKAAATTLLADALYPYTQRTGQTRFVINGKIVDVAGYRPAPGSPNFHPATISPAIALANNGSWHAAMTQSLLRSGHAGPGMAGGPVKAVHQHVSRIHHGGK